MNEVVSAHVGGPAPLAKLEIQLVHQLLDLSHVEGGGLQLEGLISHLLVRAVERAAAHIPHFDRALDDHKRNLFFELNEALLHTFYNLLPLELVPQVLRERSLLMTDSIDVEVEGGIYHVLVD